MNHHKLQKLAVSVFPLRSRRGHHVNALHHHCLATVLQRYCKYITFFSIYITVTIMLLHPLQRFCSYLIFTAQKDKSMIIKSKLYPRQQQLH